MCKTIKMWSFKNSNRYPSPYFTLQWFLIIFKIKSKLPMMAYKAFHDTASPYLTSIVHTFLTPYRFYSARGPFLHLVSLLGIFTLIPFTWLTFFFFFFGSTLSTQVSIPSSGIVTSPVCAGFLKHVANNSEMFIMLNLQIAFKFDVSEFCKAIFLNLVYWHP